MEQAQISPAPAEAPTEARADERFQDRGERRASDDRRPESFEQMLRRFKKSVDNAGILKEVRARSFFESKSQKARRKAAKAARRRTRNKSRMAE
jgi:small subunit ribosomal protein S21